MSATLVPNATRSKLGAGPACSSPTRVIPQIHRQIAASLPPIAWRKSRVVVALPGLPLARSATAFGRLSSSPIDNATRRRWLRPGAKDRRIRRDTAKLLPAFDRPVLLLWGERDPFWTLSLAERLPRLLPRAVLETLLEARTFVALDAPQRVADAIARFARGDKAEVVGPHRATA